MAEKPPPLMVSDIELSKRFKFTMFLVAVGFLLGTFLGIALNSNGDLGVKREHIGGNIRIQYEDQTLYCTRE